MSADEEKTTEAIKSSVETGVSAAAEAFNRILDLSIRVELGDACAWDPSSVPAEWNADGVVFYWRGQSAACLLLVPESGGFFPAPEADGEWPHEAHDRMTELARSLALAFGADDSDPQPARAAYVSPLTKVIESVQPSQDAALIALNLHLEESTVVAHVVGPLIDADHILSSDVFQGSEPRPPAVATPAPNRPDDDAEQDFEVFQEGLRRLPNYARSLLKVSVPLSVTLASKKQRLSDITQLVPGSILQFDKSCDEMLELRVANETIAVGEAVKVKDNFGLRVTCMTLPSERFQSIGKRDG